MAFAPKLELTMILRNAAVKHGCRTLASPKPWCAFRQQSTEVKAESGPDASTGTPDAGQMWTTPGPSILPPKFLSSARPKRKRLLESTILTLGADSTREYQGAWTRPHQIGTQAMTPAQQYADFQRDKKKTRMLGSRVEKRYVPSELIDNPPAPEDVTLELLMASQTHMGHHTSLWNPSNSPYIYGVRQKTHMISLEATAAHLRRAARVVEDVSYRGGIILFVGTRQGQMEIVTKAAALAGACHLFTKWRPGAITNRDVILKSSSTKVVDHLDSALDGFGDYTAVARPLLPDLVVCLNPLENYILLYECGLKNIPTIGVIDTNVDPSWVTYTIPANDDSLRSMAVVGGVLGRAGEAGKERRLQDADQGKVTWRTPREITRHMSKKMHEAITEKKKVMGKMQSNVQGFTAEELKLLTRQYQGAGLDVCEDEMVKMMEEAATGEAATGGAALEAAVAQVAAAEAALGVSPEEEAAVAEKNTGATVTAAVMGGDVAEAAAGEAAVEETVVEEAREAVPGAQAQGGEASIGPVSRLDEIEAQMREQRESILAAIKGLGKRG